jgi:hypothetical protein
MEKGEIPMEGIPRTLYATNCSVGWK